MTESAVQISSLHSLNDRVCCSDFATQFTADCWVTCLGMDRFFVLGLALGAVLGSFDPPLGGGCPPVGACNQHVTEAPINLTTAGATKRNRFQSPHSMQDWASINALGLEVCSSYIEISMLCDKSMFHAVIFTFFCVFLLPLPERD